MNFLSDEQFSFLEKNPNVSPSELMLNSSKYPNWNMKFIAQQLVGRILAKKKIPTLFETNKLYYPHRISMEQCSSEKTAMFKANILDVDSSGIDLTGGFGVDTYYISKQVKSIVYCEQNEDLSAIVNFNFSQLNRENIQFYLGDGLNYLQNCTPVDWIYIDPSRRKDKIKVYDLSDCIPNIFDHLKLIFRKSPVLLLKTSPLLDIKKTLSDLSTVKRVFVISVDNDCKEVLYLLNKNYEGEPSISCHNFKSIHEEIFNFTFSNEKECISHYSSPKKYLYEPNASILKAGAFKMIGKHFGLYKIHPNSHLYTSDKYINRFPGRSFHVQEIVSPNSKSIPSNLGGKANLKCRNFPIKIDFLRKKLNINDGGEYYIFATTLNCDKPRLILCKKALC